jgi:hypothetical protein
MIPYEENLKWQIEQSPFSEEFTVTPPAGGEPFIVRGIFDKSVKIDDGKMSTIGVPRIIVFSVPAYDPGKTEILVRKKTFRIQKHETDANVGCLLFLI